MEMQRYIDNIKLELTGGVLELELTDDVLAQVINRTLQEVQRYIDSTEMITVPFASCIDLTNTKVSSVSRIFRTEGYTGDTASGGPTTVSDPMYAQMWMAFTNGGTMYNLNDYMLNYMSYNTLLQMRNTTTTDLAFKQDNQTKKLYINRGFDRPASITIEYIPIFQSVEDVKSDYWIDIIQRMAIAQTKVILGRVRGRYKQSNALWTQDSDEMLAEGNDELKTLRELLRVNSQMIYPMD